MGSGGNSKASFGTNGEDARMGLTHMEWTANDRLCASTGNRRGDVEETKDMGINKAEGKMKTQHKAPWFHTQAKVHTHANKSRGVRNKGCHGNLGEPRCATGCGTHGHPSHPSTPKRTSMPGWLCPALPEQPRPLHTLTSLALLFPPPLKIQANSTQSLPSLSQQLPLKGTEIQPGPRSLHLHTPDYSSQISLDQDKVDGRP